MILLNWFRRKQRRVVLVEMGVGEAIDRFSILEIKKNKASPKERPAIQAASRRLFRAICVAVAGVSFEGFLYRLFFNNLTQWKMEDKVRLCGDALRFVECIHKIQELN